MKKIFTKAMLVAAAAMAFFACQKQEVNAPEEVKVEGLNFSAEKPEFADASKTEWTGSEIHWSKGDAIRVAYTCDGVWQNADGTAAASEENGKKTAKLYSSAQLSEASAIAKFAVPGNFKGTAEGIYEFYAVYPSGAAVKNADFPFAPSVTVDIPVEQTPLANSFDSAADIMAAKSVDTFEGLPEEEISLLWTRIVAHGHLTLKSLQVEDGEKLQTITLTADKDADMVGEHYLYLDTHNVEKAAGNNAANSLTVKADNLTIAEGGNVTFWTCFLPCTWKSVNVVVETDKATYTREIDLSTNLKTFAQNARNTLSINMSSAVREVKSSNALPFVKDFSDKTGTNGITELDGFTVSGSVYNAAGAIRLAKGEAGGSITTQSLDLSCDFHVKVTASGWDSDELSLILSSGDQSETVTLSAVGNGNSGPGECAEHIINFQPVSNSSSVTFEAAAGKRCYIKKIEILEGHAELTPVLSATNPGEMSADGGEGSFTYTLSNPKDGKTVSATVNVDWIENLAVNQEAKTVSYNVAENASEEAREGTITLSYEGAESVDVVIAQEGKASEVVKEETVIYETAFNYPINGSAYNSSTEYVGTDEAGTSWGIKYGNWNGSNCAQLRVYSAGNFGSVYMKFDVANATRVTYKAKVSNTALKLNTYYSTDSGSTWTNVNTSKALTTSLASYEFTISATGEYSKVRIKFEAAGTKPSSSNYQLTIDDVTIYGFLNGGETPEPEEPETPEEITLKSIAVSGQKTAYNVGDAFVKPTVTATYSDESTKTVTDAAVFSGYNLSAAGTQTVTVQYTEEGVTVSTTYSITVTGSTATKSWKLVTDASTLKSGDKLAIVSTSKGKIASATISSSIMGELSVTITNNSFATLPSGAAELTLGGSSGAWTLTNASGKKLGATAVKKVAWGSGTTTWTITIASNGDATIQSTTSSYGRFLHNVSSTRFTTYTSATNASMLLPQLYRYE